MSKSNTLQELKQTLTRLIISEAHRRAGPKGLGRPTAKGWHSRNIPCPCGRHRNNDKRPSLSIKLDGFGYCQTTNTPYNLADMAQLLGVTVPDGDAPLNRKARRTAATRTRRIARREKQRALARAQKELPKRLRRLYRLLVAQSLQFGTVAMSQGEMAKRLDTTRETINRKIADLRAIGWSVKLGHYAIGFNPELHHHGLEMRVCIESVFHSELALDLTGNDHTMRLTYLLAIRQLPQFVFLTGLTAIIEYRFGDDGMPSSRPPPMSQLPFP